MNAIFLQASGRDDDGQAGYYEMYLVFISDVMLTLTRDQYNASYREFYPLGVPTRTDVIRKFADLCGRREGEFWFATGGDDVGSYRCAAASVAARAAIHRFVSDEGATTV